MRSSKPRDYTLRTVGDRAPLRGLVRLAAGILALSLAIDGCAASVTVDTCSPDSSVTCPSPSNGVFGDIGYSCTGEDITPPASAGLCSPIDDFTWCCFAVTPTCMPDMSISGCSGASTGWSCSGTTPPNAMDKNLACTQGIPEEGGTTFDYCCLTGDSFDGGTCSPGAPVTSECLYTGNDAGGDGAAE